MRRRPTAAPRAARLLPGHRLGSGQHTEVELSSRLPIAGVVTTLLRACPSAVVRLRDLRRAVSGAVQGARPLAPWGASRHEHRKVIPAGGGATGIRSHRWDTAGSRIDLPQLGSARTAQVSTRDVRARPCSTARVGCDDPPRTPRGRGLAVRRAGGLQEADDGPCDAGAGPALEGPVLLAALCVHQPPAHPVPDPVLGAVWLCAVAQAASSGRASPGRATATPW